MPHQASLDIIVLVVVATAAILSRYGLAQPAIVDVDFQFPQGYVKLVWEKSTCQGNEISTIVYGCTQEDKFSQSDFQTMEQVLVKEGDMYPSMQLPIPIGNYTDDIPESLKCVFKLQGINSVAYDCTTKDSVCVLVNVKTFLAPRKANCIPLTQCDEIFDTPRFIPWTLNNMEERPSENPIPIGNIRMNESRTLEIEIISNVDMVCAKMMLNVRQVLEQCTIYIDEIDPLHNSTVCGSDRYYFLYRAKFSVPLMLDGINNDSPTSNSERTAEIELDVGVSFLGGIVIISLIIIAAVIVYKKTMSGSATP